MANRSHNKKEMRDTLRSPHEARRVKPEEWLHDRYSWAKKEYAEIVRGVPRTDAKKPGMG